MGMKFRSGGFLTTVQDAGRFGYQQAGVPVSGAMDPRSYAIGNILVGNDEGEASLEITMMGPLAEFTAANLVALTGADLSATLNGVPMPSYQAVLVKPGDQLAFGMPKAGCRAYLAVAGGFDLEPVMGSRSTYLKAKIGGLAGRKIDKGDELGFRSPVISLPNMATRKADSEDFSATDRTLRVVLGPQEEAFTQAGVKTFLSERYTVTNQSDRMGCRLDGAVIEHVKDGNIISDGISFGAIQIPTEGKPIIMLSDRQTTGGYTKIANVITVDLPLITQSKTGDIIRFEAVSIEHAQDLYLEQRQRLDALRTSIDTRRGDPAALVAPGLAIAAAALAPGGEQVFEVELDGHQYRCMVREITK